MGGCKKKRNKKNNNKSNSSANNSKEVQESNEKKPELKKSKLSESETPSLSGSEAQWEVNSSPKDTSETLSDTVDSAVILQQEASECAQEIEGKGECEIETAESASDFIADDPKGPQPSKQTQPQKKQTKRSKPEAPSSSGSQSHQKLKNQPNDTSAVSLQPEVSEHAQKNKGNGGRKIETTNSSVTEKKNSNPQLVRDDKAMNRKQNKQDKSPRENEKASNKYELLAQSISPLKGDVGGQGSKQQEGGVPIQCGKTFVREQLEEDSREKNVASAEKENWDSSSENEDSNIHEEGKKDTSISNDSQLQKVLSKENCDSSKNEDSNIHEEGKKDTSISNDSQLENVLSKSDESNWKDQEFDNENPWNEGYQKYEAKKRFEQKDSKKARKTRWGEPKQSGQAKAAVEEVDGDLFTAAPTMALAHCVGADFKMGAGIAVQFKRDFGRVGELLDQRVKQGGVAYIKHKERFVFYLVTKRESTGKPTLGTMEDSLLALRDKCNELGVTELAMPRIGCGLDRLDWYWVRSKLEEIFSGFKITVYNYNKEEGQDTPSSRQKTYIKNERLLLRDIASETGLLYIGSKRNIISEEMKSLDAKYPFINKLPSGENTLGDVVRTEVNRDQIVYGLICRESDKEPIRYTYLEQALKKLRKINNKDQYIYFGLQAFEEKDDADVMANIETLFKNSNINAEVWFCWPPAPAGKMPIKSRMST